MIKSRLHAVGLCLIASALLVALLSARADAYYGPTVLGDNPLGYWPLDEAAGPAADDASGNGEDGTYAGNVTFGIPGALAGGSGTAVLLRPKGGPLLGAPGTIALGDSSIDPGGSDFTFEAWIRPASSFSSLLIASQALPGADGCIAAQGWKLELTRDSGQVPELRFEMDTGWVAPSGSDCASPSQIVAFSSPTSSLVDGDWHYVAVSVCHGCDSATLWVDSDSQATLGVPDGGPTDAPALAIADPLVGAVPVGAYLGVDEPALYAYALVDAQVGDHYAEGTSPTTGVGRIGPIAGTPPVPQVALSHYVTQTVRPLMGASSATSLGCKEGTADSAVYAWEELILDFGVQNSNLTSTTLVGSPYTMPYSSSSTTSPGIVQWVETYAKALYNCYVQRGGGGGVIVGVGTNDDASSINSAYGSSWYKSVVAPIQSWVNAHGYGGVVSVAGAIDFEPGFHGTATASMNWAVGWMASGGIPYLNYGSADGCSATAYANVACGGTWGSGSNPSACPTSSHWNQCVLWWLSWGAGADAYAFPEIYYDTTRNYAHEGLQWTMISRYGYYYQSGTRIGFNGPLATIAGYTPKSSYNQFWCDLHSGASINTCGAGVNTNLGPRGATSTATTISWVTKIVWG